MTRRHVLAGGLLLACLLATGRAAVASQYDPQRANPAVGSSGISVRSIPRDDGARRPIDPPGSQPTGSAAVPEYRTEERSEEKSLPWDLMRTVLTLAVVLLLLGLALKLLRRFPALVGRERSPGCLQVLGRVSLTPKEAICLVRVAPTDGAPVESALLVVGVSSSGVTLLHRMPASAGQPAFELANGGLPCRVPDGAPSHAFRLRDLAARIREVQAAWGVGGSSRAGGAVNE